MNILMAFVVWVVAGLIIGAIARLIIPGPNPMSWLMTSACGILGSMLGGLIGSTIGMANGWILSIAGAMVTVVVYGKIRRA